MLHSQNVLSQSLAAQDNVAVQPEQQDLSVQDDDNLTVKSSRLKILNLRMIYKRTDLQQCSCQFTCQLQNVVVAPVSIIASIGSDRRSVSAPVDIRTLANRTFP